MLKMTPKEQFFFDYVQNHKGWRIFRRHIKAIKISQDIVRIIPTFTYLFRLVNNPEREMQFKHHNQLINQLWINVQIDSTLKIPQD
jgi:hypothetical protein